MSLKRSFVTLCALGLLFGSVGGAQAGTKEKKKWSHLWVPIERPEAQTLGNYGGTTRIALGQVTDETFSESPGFLGNTVNLIPVAHAEPRIDEFKAAVDHLLAQTGLQAEAAAEADYLLDVVVRRDHVSYREPPKGKARLRSEVFLEFRFRADGDTVGTVLACGNAEAVSGRSGSLSAVKGYKKRTITTYQTAFDDALYKLVSSNTFLALVGEGWRPGVRPPADPEFPTARIDPGLLYGPTEEAFSDLPKLREVLADRGFERLILQDFEISDSKYLEKKYADPETIVRAIPELIREHLQAFHRDAPIVVERRSNWSDGDGLVVSGELLRVDSGGKKHQLQADVFLTDAATREQLYTVRVYWMRTMGTAGMGLIPAAIKVGREQNKLGTSAANDATRESSWTGYREAAIQQLEDDLAGNLAFLLVESLVPDAPPPDRLEVQFDGLDYPGR